MKIVSAFLDPLILQAQKKVEVRYHGKQENDAEAESESDIQEQGAEEGEEGEEGSRTLLEELVKSIEGTDNFD
jgi:hypothetical protein